MRAENWLAAADAADLLVVTSTVREDTGYSGLWMLDALQEAGYQNLKYKTGHRALRPVDDRWTASWPTTWSTSTNNAPAGCTACPTTPRWWPAPVLPYGQLSHGTRMSWLRACAGMASAL
jgi:hypothetical protein